MSVLKALQILRIFSEKIAEETGVLCDFFVGIYRYATKLCLIVPGSGMPPEKLQKIIDIAKRELRNYSNLVINTEDFSLHIVFAWYEKEEEEEDVYAEEG